MLFVMIAVSSANCEIFASLLFGRRIPPYSLGSDGSSKLTIPQ